ncbi:hypothetical protein FSW04_15035 [Baekduia soli]|uniref:Uncharacterized protein n=1 Tax=Baekduia soli TaxID=496014 RepID=A0A5B8U6N7_9ACTN|nr:hypothetical protein [Baekduia soli]QEC48756.1 hypothetical protein FSW04_15035 [Baekduia soli]
MDVVRVGRSLAPVVAVLAFAAAPCSAQARTTPRRVAPARRASVLVHAIHRASTTQQHERAVLAVMRKLDVAVYTGSGQAVVTHASAAHHAFLYDFELGALGDQVARGERIPVTTLAQRLSDAGLHKPHSALGAADLAAGIAAAVQDGQRHPGSATSFPSLVLAALGRTDTPRVDIAHLKGTDSLDPLQAEIIMLGIAQTTYGTVRHVRHIARAAGTSDSCGDVNRAIDLVLSGGNDGLVGKFTKKALKTVFKREFLTKAQRAALKLASVIEDGLHGSALALSVSVHGDPETAGPVHYDHSAAEHNVLAMRIKVEMLDDYGDITVKCGPLAGLKFPKKGGIPDVPMHWDYPNLAQHGQVICGDGCNKTGPDGVATLQLAVNSERVPGYGLQQEATDNADAVAAYQSAFGAGLSNPSFWAQYFTPKIGGVRWFVTWHKAPNLTLRFTNQHDETYTDQPEGQFSSTGTGAWHSAISAVAPLQAVTTTDGTALWTGDAPINWDAFSYHDDGGKSLCQDGKTGTIDFDGSSPGPGELIVDSVQQDPAAPSPGITVVLHAQHEPTYLWTQTFHHGSSSCADFSNNLTDSWWSGPSRAFSATGVTTTSYDNGAGASPTYRITGWQPGPSSGGGEGVYAYRDFPYTTTSASGEPISGATRVEIVASPSP